MDMRLVKLYEDMYEELKLEVDALSGTIDEFIPEEKIISITVEPKYQKYLEKILIELVDKYDNKKKDLLGLSVFEGVEKLLK